MSNARIIVAAMIFATGACERAPVPVPPPAQRPLAITDTTLPPAAYPDVPGWFVPQARATGGLAERRPAAVPHQDANLRIYVFPPHDAWTGVRAGTPLKLIGPSVSLDATVVASYTAQDTHGNAQRTSIVDLRIASVQESTEWPVLWAVPAGVDARFVPLREIRATGDTMITWEADAAAIWLRRSGRGNADLLATTAQGASVVIDSVSVERAPAVLAALRFGATGPWVFVVIVPGEECVNYHLIRIDQNSARKLTKEEHYYQCIL